MKLSGLSAGEVTELIPPTPILVGYRGSIAHGMFVPSTEPDSIDDKDVMAVCIPDLKYYFAFDSGKFGDRGVNEKWIREFDCVSYEVKKFITLLVKSNPNVLGLLWLDKQHYIHVEPEGRVLIQARDVFVSKRIYHAFTGYAHGQLHRMTHQAFEGYMGQKRKALVEKHGYDTKNAAHCIRLLRMGIEFLNEGKLYVDRSHTDGPQLLEIKRGEWTLEKVKEEADKLFKRAEQAYDRCILPADVDMRKVTDVIMQILKPFHFPRISDKVEPIEVAPTLAKLTPVVADDHGHYGFLQCECGYCGYCLSDDLETRRRICPKCKKKWSL